MTQAGRDATLLHSDTVVDNGRVGYVRGWRRADMIQGVDRRAARRGFAFRGGWTDTGFETGRPCAVGRSEGERQMGGASV